MRKAEHSKEVKRISSIWQGQMDRLTRRCQSLDRHNAEQAAIIELLERELVEMRVAYQEAIAELEDLKVGYRAA